MKLLTCFIISLLFAMAVMSKSHAEEINQYGIRKDILQFIKNSVPKYNKNAYMAAITIAQQEEFIYYKAVNQQEAIEASKKIDKALLCLDKELPDNSQGYMVFKGILELMEHDRERFVHISDIRKRYFGNFSQEIKSNDNDLVNVCDTGSY